MQAAMLRDKPLPADLPGVRKSLWKLFGHISRFWNFLDLRVNFSDLRFKPGVVIKIAIRFYDGLASAVLLKAMWFKVPATGETHSVREFVEAAFAHADLDWKQFVKHDPRYERPLEVDLLLGDASKSKKILGWEPKVHFHELVRIMVDADMDLLSRGTPRKHLGKLA